MTPDPFAAVDSPIPQRIADRLGSNEAEMLATIAAEIAEVVQRLGSAPGRNGQILPAVPHRPSANP